MQLAASTFQIQKAVVYGHAALGYFVGMRVRFWVMHTIQKIWQLNVGTNVTRSIVYKTIGVRTDGILAGPDKLAKKYSWKKYMQAEQLMKRKKNQNKKEKKTERKNWEK